MSLSPALMWTVLSLTLGGVGSLVFLWAVFWDRARGRLRCPKCWYDMKGAVEAGPVPGEEGETRVSREPPWTCPECGKRTTKFRRLKRTRRRRLSAMIAAMLIVLVLYGWAARDRVIARGWIGAVPTIVLVSIPAGYDKWSLIYLSRRSDGTLPVQSSIKDECMRRYLAGGMRAPHMWVWRRTLHTDMRRAGCADLTEQDLSSHSEDRGTDDPQCGTIQRSIVLRLVTSRDDRVNWPREQLLHEWRLACDEVAKQPASLNSWMIGFPRGEFAAMSFHIAMARESLFVGPRCAILRLSQLDVALRVAANAPTLVPARSAHDLSALRELEAISCETTFVGDISLDEATDLLERLTGRRVRFTQTQDRSDTTVDVRDARHAADLCDRIADALRPSPGFDAMLWTISDHHIEFFMSFERPCMLEPRVYSIDEILDKRLHLSTVTTGRASEREALIRALGRHFSQHRGVSQSDDHVDAIGSLLIVNATTTTHARVARFLMEYAAVQQEPIPVTPPDRRGGR